MADKTLTMYMKCCDMFYACNSTNVYTFEELTNILPSLREKLTCWSCEELLDHKPFTAPDSKCSHFMCGDCRDTSRPFVGKCQHCNKWRQLKANPTLACILKGYITLCRSISDTPIKTFYQNQAKLAEEEKQQKEIDIEKEEPDDFSTSSPGGG